MFITDFQIFENVYHIPALFQLFRYCLIQGVSFILQCNIKQLKTKDVVMSKWHIIIIDIGIVFLAYQ